MTLTEFRALAERASPGPWEPWDSLYVGMKAAIVQPAANPLRTIAEVRTNFDDAKFIAAASPTAVIALIDRLERAEAFIAKPAKHRFWRPGEADCPRDIKAPNGELHTLRCKVCGEDDPRDQICRAAYFNAPAGEGEG